MLDKIKKQLEIILNHISERKEYNVHNETSQALNDIRDRILNTLDDDKELLSTLIKPLKMKNPEKDIFEISSSQAILRCNQLLEIIKDK